MALNDTDVTDAALAILDEYGLADLTMRRLADSLGVRAGALYWHVSNKQTLLAGLVTVILDGLEEPAGPWRAGLAGWADALRSRLLAHRDSADLVATMRAIGMAATDLADGIGVLVVRPGFVRSAMTAGRSMPLAVDPRRVGRAVAEADERGRELVRVPAVFGPVMTVFRLMPQALARRMPW